MQDMQLEYIKIYWIFSLMMTIWSAHMAAYYLPQTTTYHDILELYQSTRISL